MREETAVQQFTFRKGLDLPVLGAPESGISDGPDIAHVAVLGADYLGLKPRLAVAEGDVVAAGAPVMFHKDNPDALIVAPVSGRVTAINRGARRVLISVEIERDDAAAAPVDFSTVGDETTAAGLAARLCAAGLWTSFRTRPYSKVPDPATRPAAIYVTAMDTEPLCGDAAAIIRDAGPAFGRGLAAVARLSDGATYACVKAGADLPGLDAPGVTPVAFDGPHPAGLAGTHMHFLEPPTAEKHVWTIGYHDVIAIGRLLETGHYDATRVVALGGPMCRRPRLVRTVAGASLAQLLGDDVAGDAPVRVISGSILSGRAAEGAGAYLGRYARQVTVIEEDHRQIPLGWIRPMASKYAAHRCWGRRCRGGFMRWAPTSMAGAARWCRPARSSG